MTTTLMDTIQKNIKKYRLKSKLTQLKLSIEAGVSKDYITAIECGKRTPSIKRLELIAKALKIETYLLLK